MCNSACVHTACSVGTFLPVLLGATPMYISRHTWLLSPAITLYCVPPTASIPSSCDRALSFLSYHFLLSSFWSAIAKGTAPWNSGCISVNSVVLWCSVVISPWKLLEPQTGLVMAAAMRLYIQKTMRRKYNMIVHCSGKLTAGFLLIC